jgi:murein DD-endopeptidase MepM/ murein hydrolase activator NlpD
VKRALILLAALPLLAGAGKPDKPAKASEPNWTEVTEYKVRPGETLLGIARKVEVPRVLIIEANALKQPFAVKTGQVLVIPRRRSHTVKKGETGFSIAYDAGVPWGQIATANGLDPKAAVKAGQKLVIPTLAKPGSAAAVVRQAEEQGRTEAARALAKQAPVKFAWPLAGDVRRGFTPRDLPGNHDGIDIPAARGEPVRAAAPGKVVFAATEPKIYGQLVILEHGKGWFSAYAKLSKIAVKKGQTVKSGAPLGLVGNTGSTPQTELHFEIRRRAVPLDPLLLLPDAAAPVQASAKKTVPVSR